MTPHTAERTIVTKHDAEGRILEFIKLPIGIGEANEEVFAALAEREHQQEKALLRETKALVAAAKSLRSAAKPVDEKPTLQASVSPPRTALAQPAPAVARRSPPRIAAGSKKPTAAATLAQALDLLDAKSRASVLKIWAEREGGAIGKTVIGKMLAPYDGAPAGSRAEFNRDQLDKIARNVLDQLDSQNFLPTLEPKSCAAFVTTFLAGADAAVADFNERHAVRAEQAGCP